MKPHLLRSARPDDLEEITRLVRLAYEGYVPRIGAQPGPMRDDYAALIAQGRVQVLENARSGVCGLLVLIPQADAMLLDNVAVAPSAQGKGFGRHLMAAADTDARAAGYNLIRLYTNVAMVENVALYSRLGYAETRRVTERGLRRVYMEKRLD